MKNNEYFIKALIPKIENGSKIVIGKEVRSLIIFVDKHFDWFQKKMMEWFFGFEVEDYTEE